MNLRIALSPRAELDMAGNYFYIALDSEEAADRFYTHTWDTFQFLANSPRAGKPFDARFHRLKGLRTWRVSGFPNYLIFYTFTARTLDIRRVVHGAMDVEAELGRD
jgi:toxin ParE1/3/4